MSERKKCVLCNKRLGAKLYKSDGRVYYRKKCWACALTPHQTARQKERCTKRYIKRGPPTAEYNIKAGYATRPWTKYKKDRCEQCGFIPMHRVQLDVDHIDGCKQNNDPSNLQTLCSNCHRLKTYLNHDWKGRKYVNNG
jgi:hypothetical protein